MSGHGDFVEAREVLLAEQAYEAARSEAEQLVDTALNALRSAQSKASIEFGPEQCGPVVNQPLAEYRQALVEAASAAQDARRKLRALEQVDLEKAVRR